jgi:small subunit ribosomal protein S2
MADAIVEGRQGEDQVDEKTFEGQKSDAAKGDKKTADNSMESIVNAVEGDNK